MLNRPTGQGTFDTVTTPQRILVIEDDAAIRRGIVDALRYEGYVAIEAADGKTGLALALEVDCELVLLDLVLPGTQGLEILRAVRRSRPTLPVIILTAMGDEADRVRGLRGGADDYVVKPFSVSELMARFRPCCAARLNGRRMSSKRPCPAA